jgi:Ca2+-binding EF-hand superfamily protein
LKTIQDKLKATGQKVDSIFYLLDTQKKGFLTLSSLLESLPLKFSINLTINQNMVFFNYLDKNKDGKVIYEEFKKFFETEFNMLIFEEKHCAIYNFLDKIQENILFLLNEHKLDLRTLFDYYQSQRGYMMIDDIIKFFKDVGNYHIGKYEVKLLMDVVFNEKKFKELSFRKFIHLLEIIGINTRLYLNVK